MLRRLARTLVLLAAVFGVLPGGDLVVEEVVELVGHGHLAHTVPNEADPFAGEHGCSPAEQDCPCPHGQATSLQAKAEAGAFPATPWLTWVLDSRRMRPVPGARRSSADDIGPANRATAPPTPPAEA